MLKDTFFRMTADGGILRYGCAMAQEKTREPGGWDHIPLWDMGQKPDAHP